MGIIEPILSCLNSKSRTVIVYMMIYTLVVYMTLTLIWNNFLAFNVVQQVLFSAGISVCMGVMMLIFFPFVDKSIKDPYLLLLIYALFITVTFIFFYFLIDQSLMLFLVIYAVVFSMTMLLNLNTKNKKNNSSMPPL